MFKYYVIQKRYAEKKKEKIFIQKLTQPFKDLFAKYKSENKCRFHRKIKIGLFS